MKMTDRTFGVELECHGLSEEQCYLVLRMAGIPVEDPNRYNSGGHSKWQIKDDCSINSPSGRSAEVVSPILTGAKGLRQVAKVCKALTKAGAKVNTSCGLHVHVGARDLTAEEIATVTRRYAKWEAKIDKFIHPGRRQNRNDFCRSMKDFVKSLDGDASVRNRLRWLREDLAFSWHDQARQELERKIAELEAQLRSGQKPPISRDLILDTAGGDRDWKVNVEALECHNTLEFRHHHGSLDHKVVCNWIRFVVTFVERSRKIAAKGSRIQDKDVLMGLGTGAKAFFKSRARKTGRDFNDWATAA